MILSSIGLGITSIQSQYSLLLKWKQLPQPPPSFLNLFSAVVNGDDAGGGGYQISIN